MSQGRSPKTKSASKAAAEAVKQKQNRDAEQHNWEITADAETLKELSSLSRQRDQVNLKLARVHRALATAQNQLSLPQLKTFLKRVDDAYAEFSVVHTKLVAIIPNEAFRQQEEIYIAFEERYDYARTAIEELILDHEPNTIKTPTTQPQVIVQQQPLKAPIPTFDGSYANWPKFKAIFQDLMANSGDSDAIKLYHLDKALVGNAAGVLDAKVISEGNYQQAWAILTERYENKRIIVETHIRGLFDVKPMTSGSSKDLRRLLDECTNHVESLKYLEQDFLGISDLFLVHIVSSAMDQPTRMAWEATQTKGELPNYAQIISFLQTRCQILENCEVAFQQTHTEIQPKPNTTGAVSSKATDVKVYTASTEPKKDSCDFCQGPHRNYQCNVISVMPFNQRIEKVRASGVCFNCLRKGHSARECSSTKSCQKCQRRHHTQLHNEEVELEPKPSVSLTAQEPKPVTPQRMVFASASTRDSPIMPLFCNYADSSKTVFLLTAIVHTLDENDQPYPCRVLLDSGSQVNFVTADLANRLGSSKRRVNIPIRGINDVKTVAYDKVTIKFRSRVSDYETQVQCLVTPNVTGVIPATKIDVSSWSIPFDIQLADPEFYKPEKIDMLLGAELFLQLLRPCYIKLNDDFPELRETTLGWVVAGVFREKPVASKTQHSLVASIDDTEETPQQSNIEEVANPNPLPKQIIMQCGEWKQRRKIRSEWDNPNQRNLPPQDAIFRPSSLPYTLRVTDATLKTTAASYPLNDYRFADVSPNHRVNTDPPPCTAKTTNMLKDTPRISLGQNAVRKARVYVEPDKLARSLDAHSNGPTYRRGSIPTKSNESRSPRKPVETSCQPGGVCSVRNVRK